MNQKAKKLPASFTVSVIFLVLACLSYLPVLSISSNMAGGMGALGQGFAIIAILGYITLPACIISLISGIIAYPKTKLAWLNIAPILILAYLISFHIFLN